MNLKSIQEKLYAAARYADAIQAIAEHDKDNPSYGLLADACSTIICNIADRIAKEDEGAE